MSFEDKSLRCSDCGETFAFTVKDQEYFASKGYTNEPKRCSPCRQTRQTERGYVNRPQREMFTAVCAQCGKDAQVPFEPHEGKPVYCGMCYSKIRPTR
jgi:CxxC-x17-CxxC domain-containing protein